MPGDDTIEFHFTQADRPVCDRVILKRSKEATLATIKRCADTDPWVVMNRRTLISRTSALGLGAALSSTRLRAADKAGNKLKVAVIALGRGMGHVQALLALPDVEIAYLAETDSGRLDKGLKVVADKQATSCQGVRDFRKILEDKSVDAVCIATPNFWHTPMAILALQAGKHVYVEKPGSQNPGEA